MTDSLCDNSALLSPLTDLLHQRLPADLAERVNTFAGYYYQTATREELSERSLENLYGATMSCWQFLQEFSAGEPKVYLYNPDLEQHGWRAQHTVIEIVQRDMPFLVDSVRMALNRHGRVIHTIHNAIIHTQRDNGGLTGLLTADHSGAQAESVIYLEVDRTSDETELKQIQTELLQVLEHVDISVSDYSAMQHRATELLEQLNGQDPDSEEAAFLSWLLDDRFTFLGYDEIRIEDDQLVSVQDSELGIFRLGEEEATASSLNGLRQAEREFLFEPSPLMFAKDARNSLVHRPAYIDRIIIKQFDAEGNVTGKYRFHGLYTSAMYSEPLASIPVVRNKARAVLEKIGFDRRSHNGKQLLQIMNDLPRDELFLATEQQLLEIVMGIFSLNERRKARLLMRADRCNQFITFLYYVPRDIFNTELRLQVQELLHKATGALESEFTTTFSESVLARVQFILRIDPDNPVELDLKRLEDEVVHISRDWSDELHSALMDACGEEQGNNLLHRYRYGFNSAYREHFSPASAVYDLQRIEALSDANPISMSFYRVLEQNADLLRFKLFTADQPLILSDVIPVLENLGMQVVGEHPYSIRANDGQQFWMHDFSLIYQGAEPVVLEQVQEVFQQAFANIWNGRAENDEFNQLVIGAGLNWREVAMLRAYARYSQQIRLGFSQPYIAGTLFRHVQVTRLLVALFRARFEPQRQSSEKVSALMDRIESSILDALDKVDNLNDDQILRKFLELMKATLRTSFFQCDAQGEAKDYFSFKLSPRDIAGIPEPRPMFEVFVYSARVEGVHLRGGKVARGGLRWSDRLEDYRTEVLGLVKAQQVKNSVIVPVGAKGGFVAKQLPTSGGREAWLNEGIASYRIFISALLDITDNLEAGEVVPPIDVVRHDEDDPYFVVAADKGTATFSDIANEIAESRGFWLGDAFASGGSQGYDHKGMGITAKGAWESVKLHFRELGLDTQSQSFSVIGVGDMAGDVFGNGMLLSEHIQLCAAFNHLHIFIDPEPETAASFAERQRLFALPRSSWEDYNAELISAGGGIFSRAAKWLDITPEMKTRFDIQADRLSPNDLIHALLKAPVDLIWNGGIGTYVKASYETHAEVGDKANDSLRVNGSELRCKVLGEGGNLGFTQQGRMEFCARGGKSNTDFIDNAGGVDCSDHEVNIKILLNEVVANGDLTMKQRNNLLREMTDEVSELVLQNNYEQAQAISIAQRHAQKSMDEYIRLINRLETDGKLDRELEFIPSDEALQELKQKGTGLTRPELSVLISYAKAELKELLSDSWVTSDKYLSREVVTAFPQRLVQEHPQPVKEHRLQREIIATQLANGMVNTMGITFAERITQIAGVGFAEVAAAYVIARDVFDIPQLWRAIEALDNQVDAALQQQMMADLIRMARRATFWFLRQQRSAMNVAEAVEQFRPAVTELRGSFAELLEGEPRERWQLKHDELVTAGVPSELATVVAGADSLYSLLSVIHVAEQTGQSLQMVARIHFGLGDRLQLHWFDHQVKELEAQNHWESMARDGFREDLTSHQQAITFSVLSGAVSIEQHAEQLSEACSAEPSEDQGDALVERWFASNELLLTRWQRLLSEIRTSAQQDFAIFTVAIRELLELAQAK
ncbi:NAD-glutamate dehydrogenase [Amphritea balenae]|uniref:NAD-glutamate dehydrogenase n=1 Tax=Amphritea balenae TaxID=452629 RepID=A0A3P1SPM7_9GAMM|nr:NAD-glutamate dehydrogenase [Amphritea balenae]RRC98924.1 NAD-glutamate dehydrogenase [Amphritea balenae]GGK62920.1 NAD-specific glutamate dehydrogenase [Amphritea balenae]